MPQAPVVHFRTAIKSAQAQLDVFQQQAPAYPGALFQGKGIVIMAGGLTYFVPAWINIHMLRKTGAPGQLSISDVSLTYCLQQSG